MSDSVVILNELALTSGEGFVGHIHLNAPQSFNSLTLEMVQLIHQQLEQWRNNARLCAIFLDGAGEKAFCAGGDVKSLYAGRINTVQGIDNPSAIDFFNQEYALDFALHTFPKPIVCWGNGVVMGGGLGLMTACTHRIMTETSRSAMPEITIGLYPDVGGSWFLNRAPGKTGLFLGLTGANINAHDALFAGLANRFIANEYKQTLIKAMQALDFDAYQRGELTNIIKGLEYRSVHLLAQSELKQHFDLINALCDFEHLADLSSRLIKKCSSHSNAWLQQAARTLQTGCPVTAHLVFEQLQRGKYLSLEQVFDMERKISAQCMRHTDFYEGVRALLIDKDKNPKWAHASIDEVDAAFIERFF